MSRTPDSPAAHARPVPVPIPLQAGIGLRFPHHQAVLCGEAKAAWFEVHPENYLDAAVEVLERVRADRPVSLHATGLSLGSFEGVDEDHLSRIADLAARIEPGLISDHLSWSVTGGTYLPDLLPVPCTDEVLDVFARNVDRVQAVLKRPILVENPSAYLAYADSAMEEGEFLAALVARSGCGVLLDVNNVAVSAANLGGDAGTRLAALMDRVPAAAIGEIHLAGHAVRTLEDGTMVRIDDHGSPIGAEVWSLFETAIRRIGARPTLIEWDTAIPPFAALAREAAMADLLMAAGEEHHAAA
ncbi:MAG: hypothetical protein BGN85_13180 [Alphaproteobacteria bacterium 64-11]|nr:DUF692 domain-containing protein [Alphaproteobacteria bacterium]OJU11312.1 MAG: hypothetical protein BGN85_13180 [Alphaproteobacteria bacterium 64-11]